MNEDLQVIVDRAELALEVHGPPAEDQGANEYRTFTTLVDLQVRFIARGGTEPGWKAMLDEADEFARTELMRAQDDEGDEL